MKRLAAILLALAALLVVLMPRFADRVSPNWLALVGLAAAVLVIFAILPAFARIFRVVWAPLLGRRGRDWDLTRESTPSSARAFTFLSGIFRLYSVYFVTSFVFVVTGGTYIGLTSPESLDAEDLRRLAVVGLPVCATARMLAIYSSTLLI